MKGLFIPDITAEMFRNCYLESIEELMAEGEIYDIEYDPKFEETDVPDINVGKLISRQAAIDAIERNACNTQRAIDAVKVLPSVEPEIIRCKDCKHRTSYWGNCKLLEEKYHQRVFVGGDSFCSYVERRGEQNDQH